MKGKTTPDKAGSMQYISIAVAVLLIFAVSWALWYIPNGLLAGKLNYQSFGPEAGVWDLRGFDFDTGYVLLDDSGGGGTEFAPGVLLTPEEFDSYTGEIVVGPVPLQSLPVGTGRLCILMPPGDNWWMLSFKSHEYSERVYINGQLRGQVGSPGYSKEETTHGMADLQFETQAVGGVIEIVRQGSNFGHIDSSGFTFITLGRPEIIKRHIAMQHGGTVMVMGLYLCLFVLHMMLFLLLRGYRSNLWFSLVCLVWFFRTGFSGGGVLNDMFPGLWWEGFYKLYNIFVVATAALVILMLMDEFPGALQRWVVGALFIGYGGYCLFYLLAGTYTISVYKVGGEALTLIGGVYVLGRLVWLLPRWLRQGALRPEQLITLCGIALLLAAALVDTLKFNRVVHVFSYTVMEITLMAFVLAQMLAMVLGTMRRVGEARQAAQIAIEESEIARKSAQLARLRAENAEKDLELHKQLVAGIPKENLIVCGPLTLNTAAGQAYLKDTDLLLTPRDFALLRCFIQMEGQPASREALYRGAWQMPLAPKDRALDSSVYRLRQKLRGSGYTITAVRGQGFLFEKEEEVE